MKSLCLLFVFLAVFWTPASGWGYIFSRFRPENNVWGYGGPSFRDPVAERLVSPREQLMEALIGEELLENEICRGRRCTANEHCCAGHVCANFDPEEGSGMCLPPEITREGSECSGDLDCGEGLVCDQGLCISPAGSKSFNEPCVTSSECTTEKGLCCLLVRRHRQAPKRVCSYFKHPMSCIGTVETERKRALPAQ